MALFVARATIFAAVTTPHAALPSDPGLSPEKQEECSRLLVQSWKGALSQLEAMRARTYDENNSFDRRLLRALESQDKRAVRTLLGSIPSDLPMGDIKNNPWVSELPKALLETVFKEIQEEGGDLRLSLTGMTFFRVDGGKPFIVLPRQVSEAVVAHELQHFRDWRDLKRNLMSQGMSAKKASADASVRFGSPFNIFTSETRAKAVELEANIRAFQQAIDKENSRLTYAGHTAALTEFHKIEDLFHHIGWPYFEAIRRIATIRAEASRWNVRATSLPSNRNEYVKSLDKLSELLLHDLTEELIQLRSAIGIESVFNKSLFDLANVEEHFPSDLVEYFRAGIQRQEARFITASVITGKEQQQIEALLQKNSRIEKASGWRTDGFAKPESPNMYNYSRDERTAYNQLDVAGLGYSGKEDKLVCARRVDKELANPLVDAAEIRIRQQAIGELLNKDGKLVLAIEGVFKKEEYWRRNIFKDGAPDLEELYGQNPSYELVYGKLPKFFGGKELADQMRTVVSQGSSFFHELQQLRIVLSGATSTRLKSLKWILDSVSSDQHPYQVADLVRTLTDHKDLQTRMDAFRDLIAKKPKEMKMIEAAYSEVILYFDIAKHAKQNNWRVFPEILDQDPRTGPVLTLVNFHSPRAVVVNRNTSVPNSLDLNFKSGRNIIVTGPNAQGKSTYQRAVALSILQSQLGGPIPADAAKITPMTIRTYIHPSDKPSDDMSLFMTEAAALRSQILLPSSKDLFTLNLMDEVLPGTIPEIRTDVETEFLRELSNTGALSITATHNWGTTSLADEMPGQFRNFHVDRYVVKSGPTSDLEAMLDGAVEALRKVGWPEDMIARIRARGLARIRAR